MRYDAIVVGARCAGAGIALLLARKGYNVLLVDKATFPSDTMSGHFIHPRGLVRLRRWGVLDALLETGCPRVYKLGLNAGPVKLETTVLPLEGIDYSVAPRRYIIDTLLAREAEAAGAELREGFTVQELLMDGERVTGIRGRTAEGVMVTAEASLVIGADGMRSFVARAVNAPAYHTYPTKTCIYYAYWSGVEVDGITLNAGPCCDFLSFPTHDNLTCIGATWTRDQFHEVRSNIAEHFYRLLDMNPEFAARVRQGKQETRFFGTGDIPNFLRKPYGLGWALVGDAGYHKDPILGQGMSDAFIDAERLAHAIDSGFSGQRPLQEALAEYERERNVESLPFYEFEIDFAGLNPGPDMSQLLEALQANPEATRRFFATLQGSIPVQEFFSPENVGRIIAASKLAPAHI